MSSSRGRSKFSSVDIQRPQQLTEFIPVWRIRYGQHSCHVKHDYYSRPGPYGLSALGFYDYLLTIDDERELIWKHKMSPSSWIFVSSRAALVLSAIGTVLAYTNTTVSLYCTPVSLGRGWLTALL